MDEEHGATPTGIDSWSAQAEADAIARQQAIDMLDENVSELSDASEESQTSSAPSQPAALPRRRGRPPKDRSLDGDSVKRVSRPEKGGKKFHVSGLYAGEAEATPSVSSTKPTQERNVVFPNPIHFGAKLLVEERDFCLPYPIFQTMDQLREKVHAKRKPPRYQQISKNKYYSRPKLQGEVPLCNCQPGSGCGSDCINRMLQFICDPRTCPNGNSCTNVSLGRRTGIKTAVAYYGRRGFGLKTLEAIKKHDFIDEYRGEVINLSEAAKRVTENTRRRATTICSTTIPQLESCSTAAARATSLASPTTRATPIAVSKSSSFAAPTRRCRPSSRSVCSLIATSRRAKSSPTITAGLPSNLATL